MTRQASIRMSRMIGDGIALAWQVGDITFICDGGASCHMSYSSTGSTNYHESNAYMRTASVVRYTIESYGNLQLTFLSSYGDASLLLRDTT